MTFEVSVLAGFVLLALVLVICLWVRLSNALDDLSDAKRELREYRKEYWNLRDSYWELERRLNELGRVAGYVHKRHDAYEGWEKQS